MAFRKSVWIIWIIVVVGSASTICSAQRIKSSSGVQQEVKSLEQQRLKAYLKLDSVALDRIISEDYTSIYANGEVVTKPQELQWIKSAQGKSLSSVTATIEDLSVRPFGAIALLTGRLVVEGKISWSQNDFVMKGSFRYTAAYAKKPKGWQIVASQFTKIDEPAEK